MQIKLTSATTKMQTQYFIWDMVTVYFDHRKGYNSFALLNTE